MSDVPSSACGEVSSSVGDCTISNISVLRASAGNNGFVTDGKDDDVKLAQKTSLLMDNVPSIVQRSAPFVAPTNGDGTDSTVVPVEKKKRGRKKKIVSVVDTEHTSVLPSVPSLDEDSNLADQRFRLDRDDEQNEREEDDSQQQQQQTSSVKKKRPGPGRPPKGEQRAKKKHIEDRPKRPKRILSSRQQHQPIADSEHDNDDDEEEGDDGDQPQFEKHSSSSSCSVSSPLAVVVALSPDQISSEMQLLENRAKALRYREWELECANRQSEAQQDRQRTAEAIRVLAAAKKRLGKLQEDVKRAIRLVPSIHCSDDLVNKYAVGTEDVSDFLDKYETKLESRLGSAGPNLPEPPQQDESYLNLIPDMPTGTISNKFKDEDLHVAHLLSLSTGDPLAASLTKQQKKKQPHKFKQQADDLLGIAHCEPSEIRPVSALGTQSSTDEPLFELTYEFDCQSLSAKVWQHYSRALSCNAWRNLREHLPKHESLLPQHITPTTVTCLPPLSNMAGRLPSCGLCGLTVKRDDYRGRCLKNGTQLPCLVHSYQGYCLAYAQCAYNKVCIAPLMGVASPCNLNERSKPSGHGV